MLAKKSAVAVVEAFATDPFKNQFHQRSRSALIVHIAQNEKKLASEDEFDRARKRFSPSSIDFEADDLVT